VGIFSWFAQQEADYEAEGFSSAEERTFALNHLQKIQDCGQAIDAGDEERAEAYLEEIAADIEEMKRRGIISGDDE
jgi:hypothetical protein